MLAKDLFDDTDAVTLVTGQHDDQTSPQEASSLLPLAQLFTLERTLILLQTTGSFASLCCTKLDLRVSSGHLAQLCRPTLVFFFLLFFFLHQEPCFWVIHSLNMPFV